MKVFNPFGPVLAKVRIPKKIVNKINLEVDKIILNKKLSKKNDYSKKVVGQVYQEIRLSDQFTSKVIKKFLLRNISSYIKKSINHISNQLAFIGAQTRKTDQQLNFLGERLTIVTAEVSELGDADLTKLVTDLQATIVNRDAAQAAFVKIGQQSLFDFLR